MASPITRDRAYGKGDRHRYQGNNGAQLKGIEKWMKDNISDGNFIDNGNAEITNHGA